jgi:hypothetical protein
MKRDQVSNEQQKQQGQEAQRSWAERLQEWVQNNHDQQPSWQSEMRAIVREAVKDIRQTVHETFFGKPEHASEPGTPLSPTMQEVSADRGVASHYQAILDNYASRGSVHGRGQEQDRQQEQDRDRGMDR